MDADDALLVFGETTRAARRAYMSAIRGALQEDGREDAALRGPLLPRRDRQVRPREDAAPKDMLGRPTTLARPEMEAAEFVHECADLLAVPIDELTSRFRGPRLTEARELIVTLGLQRWRQSAAKMASVLGLRPESVSRISSRGRLKRAEDAHFASRFEDLDMALVKCPRRADQ